MKEKELALGVFFSLEAKTDGGGLRDDNHPISDNRNAGLRHCRGEFMAVFQAFKIIVINLFFCVMAWPSTTPHLLLLHCTLGCADFLILLALERTYHPILVAGSAHDGSRRL